MLIRYTKTNVHTFPVTAEAKEVVKLKPGLNEFPSKVWKLWEKHPIVVGMIEDGDIELVNLKSEAKGKAKPKVIGKDDKELRIKELSAKDAIKVVKETFDRDMLERWQAEETRHTVKKELDKALEKFAPAKD